MKEDSAVEFATDRRIHIGLAVHDLDASVAFYGLLLGVPPTKTRPGYARFEAADPPVNLALNRVTGSTGPADPVSHFGIQVKSSAAVRETAERLSRAAIDATVEDVVTCCYAVQSKVWATDPDGNRWEIFLVLDDRGASHAPRVEHAAGRREEARNAERPGEGLPAGRCCNA